jgi:hypothetical protein
LAGSEYGKAETSCGGHDWGGVMGEAADVVVDEEPELEEEEMGVSVVGGVLLYGISRVDLRTSLIVIFLKALLSIEVLLSLTSPLLSSLSSLLTIVYLWIPQMI